MVSVKINEILYQRDHTLMEITMNVLVVITTPGDKEKNLLALVSDDVLGLTERQFKQIDGKIVNEDDMSDKAMGYIVHLYNRFGLEPNEDVESDLKEYLGLPFPCVVDRVLRIGWAV